MKVLVVDWLGRGGIAQTSMAWRRSLLAAGAEPIVVTRAHRELLTDVSPGWSPPLPGAGRLLSHRAVVHAATRAIALLRPDLVVVQNYVVPSLEQPVYRMARRVGATVATVVHDHRLHSRLAGSGAGLSGALAASDVVVAHSTYVAERLDMAGGDLRVIPHPLQLDMLTTAGDVLWPPGSTPTAVHFGVVKRGYKGTDLVVGLSQDPGTRPWRFAVLGTGAPRPADRLHTSDGYVPAPDLVASVAAAEAALLPYTFATQSGAVVLAQALGTVCVASAVGGIPEQIIDGVTGLLIPPGAGSGAWVEALRGLAEDPSRRAAIGGAASSATRASHRHFDAAVRNLLGLPRNRTSNDHEAR